MISRVYTLRNNLNVEMKFVHRVLGFLKNARNNQLKLLQIQLANITLDVEDLGKSV